jgi:hypothetical protein
MATGHLGEKSYIPERRHEQRRKFRVKIEMEWGSAILAGTVRDIGPGGMFIELTPPLWLGARFVARMDIHPPLQLDCTVSRVDPGNGIAVTFSIPQDSGKVQLEKLLATLPVK